MPRPIWKGHVSFGLVNLPVVLHSLEKRADIGFHLIDSRDAARVRYERINEETGEEVPWDKIVKGYEYSDGNYVLMSEEELDRAAAELTRTIEIEQFVDVGDIDLIYVERPYLLVPDKNGEKGYVLLREAMKHAGKAGIAGVVIRARQYLCAVLPVGDALILEILRYPQEVRAPSEFDLPSKSLRTNHVSKKEIELANKLISGMSNDWKPTQYHDEYREALMAMIQKKIKSGQTEAIEVPEEEEAVEEPRTINFMDVLKQSVEHATKRRPKGRRAPKRKKATPRKKSVKKKRAG